MIETYLCAPVSCIKTGAHSTDFVHCSEMKKCTKLSEMKINGDWAIFSESVASPINSDLPLYLK